MKKLKLLSCLTFFSTITAGNYRIYNYYSNPPIIVSTICGNLDQVKKECTPANINTQNSLGQTALMLSCINNSGDIFVFLMENNADFKIKDKANKTALDYAIEHNRAEMIEFLLLSGVDGNLSLKEHLIKVAEIENINKQTQNMFKELYSHDPNINIIKSCISAGADVNSKDVKGNTTALKLALAYPDKINVEIVKLIIDAGGDISDKSTVSKVMKMAVRGSNCEILKLLISSGIDQECKNTALKDAAYFNVKPEIARLLIDAGADVNAKFYEDETALMAGIFHHNTAFIRLLLDAGADIYAKDKYGDTAYQRVLGQFSTKNNEITRLLKNHKTKLDAQKNLNANKNIVKKTATNKQNNRAKLTNKAKIILSKKIKRK